MLESIQMLMGGFAALFTPSGLFFCMLGVVIGLAVGALPGVGGTTGVVILLPITVYLEPLNGLTLLAGIYWGSMYGGLVSSILFAVPGNPWSVATMFDGRPMALKGKAGVAMAIGFWVSFFGAIIASVLFTLFAKPFAEVALTFGPPSLFAVLMIAFGTFVGWGGSPWKALAMIAVGFLLAVPGIDPVTGVPRLTFGSIQMLQGFHFVPITIGLFGVGEILSNAADRYKTQVEELSKAAKLGMQNIKEAAREVFIVNKFTAIGCALLGFFLGTLPGAGATPGSFLGYGAARKFSKNPELFGTGIPAGVVAPEAANNAAGTGAILPLLVLGIPGSPTAAIMMAGIFMWGFIPGPTLFLEEPEFVWGFIASLYVANIFAIIVCLTATPALASILRTPYSIIASIIIILSFVGAYAIQNSLLDVWYCFIFGILGFIFRRLDFPLAPLVVALVLGFPTEQALRQSLIMSEGDPGIFFSSPQAAIMMCFAIFLFLLPAFTMIYKKMRASGSKKMRASGSAS